LLLAAITLFLALIARLQFTTSRAQLRAYVGISTADYAIISRA